MYSKMFPKTLASSLVLIHEEKRERKKSKQFTHPYPPPWNCVAPSLPKLKLIIIFVCAQKVW